MIVRAGVLAVAAPLFLAASLATPAVAQDRPESMSAPRPRVGVALSGGGAKGFAHVGALRVIEAAGLPVDVVAGTSMGSFIGGLYAIGFSVDQLDSLLHTVDFQSPFQEDSPRRRQPLEYRLAEEGLLLSLPLRRGQVDLPRGLNSGQAISEVLSDLLFPAWDVRDFRRLPRSFGALAADLSDGRAVLLTSGDLPEAIRASTSIPSIFEPVVIDGRTYVDGGVTRNLPAEDARALGADAVICVDVGEPVLPVDSLETFLDVMVQAVGFRVLESTREQRRMCDVLITPEVTGFRGFDFDRTDELIERGEEAALRVAGRLEALRDSLFGTPAPAGEQRASLLGRPDSVFVADMRIEGAAGPNEAVIRRAMRLATPGYLSKAQLEAAVQRAYGTRRFARVSYHLDRIGRDTVGPSAAILVVRVAEAHGDRLAVGIRYDSDYQASILMRVMLAEVFGSNQRLVGSLRLGEVVRLGATLTTPLGFGPRARLFTDIEASRSPIDLFEGATRTSNLAVHTVELGLRAGGPLLPDLATSVGVRAELFDVDPRIAGEPNSVSLGFLNETSSLVYGEARLVLDTFDRVSFARTGARIAGRSILTLGPLSSDTFSQHWIDAEGRIPLGSNLSVYGRVAAGHTAGSSTPVHHRFFAGGPFPFEMLAGHQVPLLGHEPQEVAGPNLRAVWTGVQVQVRPDVYIGTSWNAAAATEAWSWTVDPGDFVTGVGFTAGFRTVIGPVLVVLTSSGIDGPYELHLSVGHTF